MLIQWAARGAEPTQVTYGEIEPQCVLWQDNSGLCVLRSRLCPVTPDLRAAVIAAAVAASAFASESHTPARMLRIQSSKSDAKQHFCEAAGRSTTGNYGSTRWFY